MPYNKKNKFSKKSNSSRNLIKEELTTVNLNVGRLQTPEYVTQKQAKEMLREFFDDDAALLYGVGPQTDALLEKHRVKSIGQVLNKIKTYKDPKNSELYQSLPPQAKLVVSEMLKNPMVTQALHNYHGPRVEPVTRTTKRSATKHRKRKTSSRDLSWWRKILKKLGLIS